jgi:hypothetical protein
MIGRLRFRPSHSEAVSQLPEANGYAKKRHKKGNVVITVKHNNKT